MADRTRERRRASSRCATCSVVVAAMLAVVACDDGATDDPPLPVGAPAVSAAPPPQPTPTPPPNDTATDRTADHEGPDESDQVGADVIALGSRCRPDLVPHASSDPSDRVSITVWHTVGNDVGAVFEEVLDRFRTVHPGIELAVENLGGLPEIEAAFTTAGPDEIPDLVMGQVDVIRSFADSGRFLPPVTCTDGDVPEVLADLLPIVAGTYRVRGEFAAVPFLVSTPVLVFDAARFAAAGLDPTAPPGTADELAAAARALVSSGAAPGGLAMYDRSASWIVEQWAAREGRELVEPANGHGAADDTAPRAVFGTEDDVAALTWLRDLTDEGLLRWLGLNGSGLDDLFALVDPAAPAGMTLHTSAAIGDLTRLLTGPGSPFPDVELGIGALPGPGRGALVGGNNWWVVDGGDPVRAGAAWMLAEWLASPDQQAQLTTLTGYAPVTAAAVDHPDVAAHWDANPNFAVPYRQLAEAGSTPGHLGMQIGPRVAVQRMLEIAAAGVIANGEDPAAALDRARVRADELLALYHAAPGEAD